MHSGKALQLLDEVRNVVPVLACNASGIARLRSDGGTNFGTPNATDDALRYRPTDLIQTVRLLRQLNPERPSIATVLLLLRHGSRLCLVERDGSHVVALNLYYFRQDEPVSQAIHEAFIGVAPAFRGRGVGAKLRESAAQRFGSSGLRHITTRIEENNSPSLVQALALGFSIVDTEAYGSTRVHTLVREL